MLIMMMGLLTWTKMGSSLVPGKRVLSWLLRCEGRILFYRLCLGWMLRRQPLVLPFGFCQSSDTVPDSGLGSRTVRSCIWEQTGNGLILWPTMTFFIGLPMFGKTLLSNCWYPKCIEGRSLVWPIMIFLVNTLELRKPRCILHITDQLYWPEVKAKVKKYCTYCPTCQLIAPVPTAVQYLCL